MEGNTKHQVVDREVVYDFDKERELQMVMSCCKISFYSFVLTIGDKTRMLETLHMVILAFYDLSLLTTKLQSNFKSVLEFINKGFYTYEEDLDERHYETTKNCVRRIRLVNKWFRIIIVSSGFSFLLFNTAKKYIENSYKKRPSSIPINPYFPIPFYVPFDTSSVLTFTIAYLSNVAMMYSVCMVAICIEEIYISLLEQLKAQFEILNLSISNVVDRALRRYFRGKAGPRQDMESLYQKKEFQDCLLEFTRDIRSYVEMTFFFIAVLSTLTLSLAVLVITKSKLSNEELLGVGTFIMMLFTELLFTLQFCLYGEELSNESARFSSLFGPPLGGASIKE
ncbi:unnamed protein product [Nezara viridula]|uniref:Odorant receptor n=1 Tax=Nezara viridula TaxID=85310 RepID=A0A9P0HSQ1_NEZVI|nr:unnamed protein product [Nezara viridula]